MTYIAMLIALIWLIVITVVHEAGHAAMAIILGERVEVMRIGLGPVKKVSIPHVPFPIEVGVMALAPVGGWVRLGEREREIGAIRRRSIGVLISLAGPAMNLAIAFFLAAAVGWFGLSNSPVSFGWDTAVAPSRAITTMVGSTAEEPHARNAESSREVLRPIITKLVGLARPETFDSSDPADDRSRLGLSELLLWLASVSAVVGTFNLLPIPPLDGGQAVCQFLPQVFALVLSAIGAVVLVVLLALTVTLQFG